MLLEKDGPIDLSFMHRVVHRSIILAMLSATSYFLGLRLQCRFCGVDDAVRATGQNVGASSNFGHTSFLYGFLS